MDKSLEKTLTRWLKQQKKACGFYLNLSIVFGVLTGVCLVIQAALIATVLDGIIMQAQPKLAYTTHFFTLLLLIVVRAILAYGRERASFEAGVRLRQQMRQAVLDKLAQLGPAFIKGKRAGSWASLVLEQVEDLHDFYGRYLPQIAIAGFIPLIILAVVFPINWAAGLILLLTAPLIPLFMILVGMGAADANRKNFSALARLSGHFMDRLKGLSTLKLFYQGEVEAKAINRASEDFRERTMSVLRMAFLSSAVLEFFAAISIAVLAVYFGFSYLGHLDFGHYDVAISLFTGLFVLMLAPEFYQPLRDMGTHYHAKAQAIGAAESLKALLETEVITPCIHNSNQIKGNIRLAEIKRIKLQEVSVFSFDGVRLLGPISLEFKLGEHIAIVGPSGAGKTTLLNVLLGFLPYQGQITINDVALNDLDLCHWRAQLAWLGQEPQLFHGTVRDNISMGKSSLTDAKIKALLSQASVLDFVESLPQGLAHPIDEQSQGLSVGQAQRLALARALAQDAQWYFLDEPSASLDSLSEQLVMSALKKAMQQRGCLMVTHRLDQLSHTDRILVIDKGLIAEQGSFEELSRQQGLFSRMMQESQTDDEKILQLLAKGDTTPKTAAMEVTS